VPAQVASQTRDKGMLEVTIDEQGRVILAKIRMSLHPLYDSLLVASARDWKYQPAMHAGRPVKFRKVIQITVTK
jgi:TonB family protein